MDENIVVEEVERKYLLLDLPDEISFGIAEGKYKFEEIEQGYSGDGSRFRKALLTDEKVEFSITKKEDIPDTNGISKKETTKIIDKFEYESLLEKIEGELIRKTRYFVPFENEILEINMFHGRLEGKVLVEIEFETYEKALEFDQPDFLGREVTNELSNRDLAMGAKIPQE